MNFEKKQKIFNYVSLIIIFVLGIYYLGRLVYFKYINNDNTILSDLLAEQIKQRRNKYEIIPTLINDNNTYRFINKANNNYVKFMGYTWRIIKVNEDNTITLITDDNIISLNYGNISSFNDSYINKWLNDFNIKYTGIFYNTLNHEYLVNTNNCFDKIENISCDIKNNDYKVSLLSLYDYEKAGGMNSYLNNNSEYWLVNNSNNNSLGYVKNDGTVSLSNRNFGVRPVITLKSDTKVISGNGSSDNPYIIEKHLVTSLKDAYIGEYIKLNNSLWRIVFKDIDKIKLVSEESVYETYYSNYDNSTDLNLLNYLNNDYYNNFEEKELIVSGKFYDGVISDYDYTTTYNSSINLNVGLLSIAEPFVYDVENTFTISRTDNETGILIIDENNNLFEDTVSNYHYVRPSIYIKNDVTISGMGTYLNPYIIGGEINEN